LIGQA